MSKTTAATVKVMLSHNYCHFEVSKQIEGDDISQQDIDAARKDCQRLADRAVEQYKRAKDYEAKRTYNNNERLNMEREVALIRQKPEEQWTVFDKAKVKALEDYRYESLYNYEDDPHDPPF